MNYRQLISYLAGLLSLSRIASAQIVPDATLPQNSLVTSHDKLIRIEGGTQAGENLFHSFESFSVPTGNTAFFNNASNIQNIFSRVTGGLISHIDGVLKANGVANLFLLNPNGIIFGPNASLNIGGSFFGSTASSIDFADGTSFSATSPSVSPVLTVSVPIGLGFGSHPGTISVQGEGHLLTVAEPIFSPVNRKNSLTGLRLQPEKTLALIGGNLVLEGATLTTEGGRIELGSVAGGWVSLKPTFSGWMLGYERVPSYQDISLSQRALVDTSGVRSGSIQLQGQHISIREGSALLIQNQGSQPAGNIILNASESLQVNGTDSTGSFRSLILNEALEGHGGDIVISTNRLTVEDGAAIATKAYDSGRGGDLSLNVSESVQVTGFSSVAPQIFSFVVAGTFGAQNAGDVTLTTENLLVKDTGTIGSVTFGNGNGGNLNVKATEINVIGASPILPIFSALLANSAGNGNSGQINIDTSRLTIGDGGVITTATAAAGRAGAITINASEFVELSGKHPIFGDRSRIISATTEEPETVRQLFRLPLVASGASGDVRVNTKLLMMDDGVISVANRGLGNAGELIVNAESILLSNSSEISARTLSGEGGNITFFSKELQLRHDSEITTTARSSGNGGNLTIDVDTLVALENSDITANAVQGRGGNIQLNAKGVFLSPDSEITASSELGIDGTVEIDTPDLQIQNSLEQLNAKASSPDEVLAGSCLERRQHKQKGSFTYTGVEGLPVTPSPAPSISIGKPLTEIQSVPEPSETPNQEALPHSSEFDQGIASPFSYQWKPGMPIIEGSKLVTTSDGRLLWVASAEQIAAIEAENQSNCR